MKPVLWFSGLRFVAAHRLQACLSILGVALGVAVVVGIDLARASAARAFDLSTEAVVGRATHRIVGGPAGVDEAIYVALKRAGRAHGAAPVVQGYASVEGRPGETVHVLGVDPLTEARGRRGSAASRGLSADGKGLARLITRPATALLSATTAAHLGIRQGEALELRVGTGRHRLEVIGWLRSGELGEEALDGLAVTDISTAQELFGVKGRLSYIDLVLEGPPPGRSQQLAAIRTLLPPAVALVTTAARTQTVVSMTRAFHMNLAALSLMAVMVGAFLIHNTLNFLVVRQRPLLGALRAIGALRAQLFALVVIESLAIAGAGTLLGLGLGYGLARALIGLVTATINDLYYGASVRNIALEAWVVVKGLGLGLGVGLAAAVAPALEAARLPPRLALMRSHLEAGRRRKVRAAALTGLVAIAGGTALLLWPGLGDLRFGFVGLFGLIFGSALLVPASTLGIVAALSRLPVGLRGALLRTAVRSVGASLSRTGVALAALMLAVSTTIAMGLMIGSFRIAVSDWLGALLQADLYVWIPGPAATGARSTLDRQLAERLRGTPGIAAVSTVRRYTLEDAHGTTEILAYELAPASHRGFRFIDADPERIWPAFEHEDAVLASEPYARRHGLYTGGSIRLRTERGGHDFRVAGIYRDYGSDQGALAMSRRTFDRHWEDERISSLGIYGAPGVDEATLQAKLRAFIATSLPLVIRSNRKLLEASLEVFDRSFAVTEVLRLLVGAVAFLGVLSAVMATELERGREHGVLRALGVTPAQLGALVATESGVMGLVAGLVAIPVGVLTASALVGVIIPRSFGWTMALAIDPLVLAQGLLIAMLAALLAGAYPAWSSAYRAPAQALREE